MFEFDKWVSDQIVDAMKDVATYITVAELKRLVNKRVPPDKLKEFSKRLTESFNLVKLRTFDYALKLRDYPGMVLFLKDEGFRKSYLKFDTGRGVVLLDRGCRSIIREQSKTSYTILEHKLLQLFEGVIHETLEPTFAMSVPGTINRTIELFPGPKGEEYSKRVQELERGFHEKYVQLGDLKRRVLGLETSVKELDESVRQLIQRFAELIHNYVKVYDGIIEAVWADADRDKRLQILTSAIELAFHLSAVASFLDTSSKFYGMNMRDYAYWPYENVGILTRRAIRLFRDAMK